MEVRTESNPVAEHHVFCCHISTMGGKQIDENGERRWWKFGKIMIDL